MGNLSTWPWSHLGRAAGLLGAIPECLHVRTAHPPSGRFRDGRGRRKPKGGANRRLGLGEDLRAVACAPFSHLRHVLAGSTCALHLPVAASQGQGNLSVGTVGDTKWCRRSRASTIPPPFLSQRLTMDATAGSPAANGSHCLACTSAPPAAPVAAAAGGVLEAVAQQQAEAGRAYKGGHQGESRRRRGPAPVSCFLTRRLAARSALRVSAQELGAATAAPGKATAVGVRPVLSWVAL